jgi:predicted  nucleic acid-binding Zn-ribbon protein
MLEFLFPNAVDLAAKNDEIKELKEELKSLEASLETEKAIVKAQGRRHEQELYDNNTSSARSITTLKDEKASLERRIRTLEEDLAEALVVSEDKVQARALEVTYNAEYEANLKVEKEVDKLKSDVARETAQAAAAQALVGELKNSVARLESNVQDYREFVMFILTKLPEVDLSKFNINIDVPAAEVKVVSNNQKKS